MLCDEGPSKMMRGRGKSHGRVRVCFTTTEVAFQGHSASRGPGGRVSLDLGAVRTSGSFAGAEHHVPAESHSVPGAGQNRSGDNAPQFILVWFNLTLREQCTRQFCTSRWGCCRVRGQSIEQKMGGFRRYLFLVETNS